MINLHEVNNLRNKLIHGYREATRSEAEFLFQSLQMILETFGIISLEDSIQNTLRPVQKRPKVVRLPEKKKMNKVRPVLVWSQNNCHVLFGSVRIVAEPQDKSCSTLNGIVVEEDTYLILSTAGGLSDSHEDVAKLMKKAVEYVAETPGSVIVKGKRPVRFLAIVYDFNQEPPWREEWIGNALDGIFRETENLRLKSLALPLLGTVHGSFDKRGFVELLSQALKRAPLTYLKHIRLIVPPGTNYEVLEMLASDSEE